MRYFQILLSLAAAASAVDVRFHSNNGCSGTTIQCGNLGPDSCCGLDNAAFKSMGFDAIPLDWSIETRSYNLGRCSHLRLLLPPQHTAHVCHDSGDDIARYTGGGYGFRNRKVDACGDGQECKTSQKPDTLILEEGQKYAVTDMGDDLLNEL
ncbi:hypothetical protein BDV96DRAFT_661126 [Lophiotrema nucula]|uniref:Hydrophobin n=1 Tax=Lophiotrema nucula TaxID=690887 RepID=A0A6A5Z6D6_9PLEO|nr:hypothetical protein BDV96DRAFT_661126 [Lophiotrema nucula]